MVAHQPQAPYFIWHEMNKGTIARYHLDQHTIDSQLQNLRVGGADGISLSPWFMKNATGLGTADTFIDWSGGQMTVTMENNFQGILGTIKDHGFNFVQIAPQFYGPNDFRQWTSWQESLYDENWTMICHLKDLCDQHSLPYLIDVCAEFNANYKADYVHRMWIDTTSWFYPKGMPVWNFTMSFVPADYANVADGFLNNVPMFLAPHPYTNEGTSFYDILKGIRDGLTAASVPARTLFFGETDTLQHSECSYVDDCTRFVQETKQPIERVCPWPVNSKTAQDVQIDPACVPQRASAAWTIGY